jgi:hypothetical protein
LEADYFIQAQDYADDWLGHVAVKAVKLGAVSTTVAVDLGVDPATLRRLAVTLVREGGTWKISKVVPR